MKKGLLEKLLGALGVSRTEQFFLEIQETREAMRRIANLELGPYAGSSADKICYSMLKKWSVGNAEYIKSEKSTITLLTPSGRWCSVPPTLQGAMDIVREKDRLYMPFYVKDTKGPIKSVYRD